MAKRPSLERQITVGLIVYSILLTIGVFTHGLLVNERVERLVWEAMLDTEMENFVARRADDPAFTWRNTGKLDLYVTGDAAIPPPAQIATLAPGLHDNVFFGDNEWVVLVRESAGDRYILALDIDGFEDLEWQLVKPIVITSVVMLLVLGIATFSGARLLSDPLRRLARGIASLQPEQRGQQVEVTPRGSAELVVIADALNDYLSRNDQFVERERGFIDTASHELRTPIAVIRGAAELAAADPDLPAGAATQLRRIATTTREVEQLVSLLLVLARDPDRMRSASEAVALDQMLPAIVDDHRHLCAEKDLVLVLAPLPRCTVLGPDAVIRASIGNLLRNAIENSDRGEIRIALDARGLVRIEDPGHGMSPEEISAIYARIARGGVEHRGGIGLALIARLCTHLGWHLAVESLPERGTVATLDLGRGPAA